MGRWGGRKLYTKHQVSVLQEKNYARDELSHTMNVLRLYGMCTLNCYGQKENTETKARKVQKRETMIIVL